MGEFSTILEAGSKELTVFPAFESVTPEELNKLGLDSQATVFVGHLDTTFQPKIEGETRDVYRQLREHMQKRANATGRTIVYRFGTSDSKLQAFAESSEFKSVFGNWDARSQKELEKFYFKQFYPMKEEDRA